MDILAIYLTHKITHKKVSKARLLIAASVGSASATVLTLLFQFEVSGERAIYCLMGFAVSTAMAWISFGMTSGVIGLLRISVILWGGGALLGGVMTVITSLGEPVYTSKTSGGFIPVFAACFTVTTLLVRLFSAERTRKIMSVTIFVMNEEYRFFGICDSGSFLTEPISGKPVIIVKKAAVHTVAERLEKTNSKYKLRLIPASGIGGQLLLKGFIPDKVCLNGEIVDAVIAIDNNAGKFSGQDGIIPAVLCK